MNLKVFENHNEDKYFIYLEQAWETALRYAQSKPPLFHCLTDTGEQIILIPYMVDFQTDNHIIDVSYQDFAVAKSYIVTEFEPTNEGTDIQISITVNRKSQKTSELHYPECISRKEAEIEVLGQFKEAMPYSYEFLGEFPYQNLFFYNLEVTDLHHFYKYKAHIKGYKITEITQIYLS